MTSTGINNDEHNMLTLISQSWLTWLLVFAVNWCILFRVRSPLQYYVKFATYFVMVMIYSLSILPIALLRPNNCQNINYVAKSLSVLFKIFGLEIILENGKYLQINQPYVLICNHQSAIDFITMMKVWPGGNCTPLAKKELFWTGPFGLAIWLCGITFIDRLNHEKAKGTIVHLSERTNNENLRVWIFPEGTRSNKTTMLPFKKGAFHLAVEAQVPVVSVVISSYLDFFSHDEKKFLQGGKIKVRVLPPFQTKGMTADDVNQLTKHLQGKMQQEYDLLNSEINLSEQYLNRSACTEDLLNSSSEDTNNKLAEDLDQSSLLLKDTFNSTMEKQILNDDNNNSINDEESNKKIS